ncbi:flagellar basal-body MS-ring/collar protein FliF [Nocardioides yefusunii]|uniref:Flagellar M-ring protein n=1 Tax=Nocardioides yefusunii TaxID=2500546 RepID=A0ABW1QZ48_9ACTN|nr:flagellar basal-body MS-ring/collar protein FliF [Nocardioides yefusunii]
MKDTLLRFWSPLQPKLAAFSLSQKISAAVGALALVAALVMVGRWITTPTYAPLFSQMASADASAVIDELTASGVPYELSDGGQTVSVPKDKVYATRIALSGKGLPASNDGGGYSLLDGQGLSTSQFQEETSFKRAMEGELANTVKAIDGVTNAVVHLAIPSTKVFATEQDPATASVLVATRAGTTLSAEQVQAVVHLVAFSIEGLSPDDVTVADSTGKVLSSTDAAGGGGASTRTQAVTEYQNELNSKIQRTLDTVLGPGNSTVAVTANLDFDKAVRTETTYSSDEDTKPLSRTESEEVYAGRDGRDGDAAGVVGADGNTELDAENGEGDYSKRSSTQDNALNSVVEQREASPGSVKSLHIGVAMDSNAGVEVSTADMRDLIAAAIGEDLDRGDTVEVTSVPFDQSAKERAQAELDAAEAEEARQARNQIILWAVAALGALALITVVWVVSRRRAKARAEATEYVVEQLRLDAEERAAQAPVAPVTEITPALGLLEATETNEVEKMRDELASLVERQPEDVAALLRGWLVEPPR